MKITVSELKALIRESIEEVYMEEDDGGDGGGSDDSASEAAVVEAIMEKYMGFKKLKKSLAHKKGIKNPGGLAAWIGRKKYGKKKFQAAAAKGESPAKK